MDNTVYPVSDGDFMEEKRIMDTERRKLYANRLKGREDFLQLLDQQEHAACGLPCDKCPFGSKVQHPKYFHCAIPLLKEIADLLVPVPKICSSCGQQIAEEKLEMSG